VNSATYQFKVEKTVNVGSENETSLPESQPVISANLDCQLVSFSCNQKTSDSSSFPSSARGMCYVVCGR